MRLRNPTVTILGKIENVTVRYEKVLLIFFHVRKFIVTFNFEPEVSLPIVNPISDSMRMLGATYLI